MALHYVVADARDKRPLAADYLIAPATADEIAAARSEPWLTLGHVPGRAGLLVVDIDRDTAAHRDAVIDSLGPPLCEVRTRRGIHLYYRTSQPAGNRSWEGGEIRCTNGYAVLWDEDAVLAALENVQDAEPVDVSLWPISKQKATSRKPRRKPKRASKPSASMGKAIRGWLRYLDCRRLSYDEWLHVGFGLHQAYHYGLIPDGLALWVEFSQTDPDRYVEGECAAKWRGFDPDGGITYRKIRWLAHQNGYRPRKWRKAINKWGKTDDPDLNGRQQQEMDHWYAQAKQERASRKGGLLVQVNQSDTAALMRCSRRTVVRDVAHLQDLNRMREVGRATVRHAAGGHVETVYELIPNSTRHQKPVSLIPDDQQAAWQECVEERQDVPDGPRVSMGGRVYVLIPPHLTGGLPKLVPADPRAPP